MLAFVRALCVLCGHCPRDPAAAGGRARFTKLVNRPGKHERRRKGLSAIRGVRRRSKTGPNCRLPLGEPGYATLSPGPQTRTSFPFLARHSLCLFARPPRGLLPSPSLVPRRIRPGLYSISFDLPKSFLAGLSRHRFSSCPCGRFRIAPAWRGRLFYEIEGRKTKSNNDDVTRRLDRWGHFPRSLACLSSRSFPWAVVSHIRSFACLRQWTPSRRPLGVP